MSNRIYWPGGIPDPGFPLEAGQPTFPRQDGEIYDIVSGNLYLTYWYARHTATYTQLRMITSSTAAAATPTLCKMGVYQVSQDDTHTRIGVTANDTALFAGTYTRYTRSTVAAFKVVENQLYASSALVVTAGACPTFCGYRFFNGDEAGVAPRMTGAFPGQTDMPASFAGASVANDGARLYMVHS